MAFRSAKFYQAVCDGCETHYDGEDNTYYADEDIAEERAVDGDWLRQDDGRLLCFDCRFKAGDLSDEPADG